MWTPDLTLSVKTNELSHLEQQPTRCDYFVENPEEQVHWLLTRRGPLPGRRQSKASNVGTILLKCQLGMRRGTLSEVAYRGGPK